MLARKIEQLILQNEDTGNAKNEWYLQGLLKKATQRLQDNNSPTVQFKLLLHRLNDANILTKLCKLVLDKKSVINPQHDQILFKYDNVFHNIIFLNIGNGGNMITNIQSLTFLDMPCMLFLYIFQNKCISLKPLTKVNFKSLTYLNLPVGEIKSLSGIQRANLPMLEAIITYENKIHTFYELFKLNSSQNKYILMGDQFDHQHDSSLSYTRLLKKQLSFR